MQSPGGSKKVQATADPIKVKADTVRAAVQAMLLVGKSASSGTASALNPGAKINGVLFTGASDITITASAPHALSFGTHITPASGSYDGSAAVTIATDATNLNTASTIVARDGSGNFSVGAITHAGTDVFSNASPFSVANGQTLTVSVTAQTVGAATLTIPNFASVSDTFAFVTLAQTLANKTLASSCSVPASTLTGNLAYAALPTGSGSWDVGSGNTTTITRALTVSGQMTASVGVTGGSNALAADYLITLNTAAGQNRNIEYLTGGLLRWEVAVNNATESGSNVGSNFKIVSFDDTGALIGNAMVITRSTMAVNFAATVTAATGFINGSNTLAATLGCIMNTAAGQLRQFDFQSGGVDRWLVRVDNTAESGSNAGSNFSIMARSDAGASIGSAIAITRSSMLVTLGASLGVTGLISTYNNVNTAGLGVGAIYASGRVTAKTNVASGTICTYTPAADGTFVIYANVNVTTSTTFSFTVTCTYTDEGGTSRTQIFSFAQVAGTLLQTLTNTTGAGTYVSVPFTIRAKGANAITIQTAAGGTYTNVVFNASAAITQLAA